MIEELLARDQFRRTGGRSMIEELRARDEIQRPRWARGAGPDGAFNLIKFLPVEILREIDTLVRGYVRQGLYVWRRSLTRYPKD